MSLDWFQKVGDADPCHEDGIERPPEIRKRVFPPEPPPPPEFLDLSLTRKVSAQRPLKGQPVDIGEEPSLTPP